MRSIRIDKVWMVALVSIAVQLSCARLIEALELRVKNITVTMEAQEIIEGWGSAGPTTAKVTPKNGYAFVLIDIEVINRTSAMVDFEGDKLTGSIGGQSIDLMHLTDLKGDRRAYIGAPFRYALHIPANGSQLLQLLAGLKQGDKPITIRYGKGIRSTSLKVVPPW